MNKTDSRRILIKDNLILPELFIRSVYHDFFTDGETFHWQTQNSVGPDGGRGRGLINHKANGSKLHLFVRKNKMEAKKAAPFYYCGPMEYVSHEGEKPMSVVTGLDNELSEYLKLEFIG